MSDFQFTPTTLLTVLTSSFYEVPTYQRSYSWDDTQIEDFWIDITRAISGGGQYFLGTLVFSVPDQNSVASVIDGQQRLATTIILLCAIRDHFSDNGETEIAGDYRALVAPRDMQDYEHKPRLRLNPSDHPYFNDRILKREVLEPTAESHIKIAKAYNYFSHRLTEIVASSKSADEWKAYFSKLYGFLNQKARVVTVKAPSDADAFVIFETLNDRGADLTIADLLKNYLFSRAKDDLATVQERWAQAQSILQEYQDEKQFVVFLRHLWSSMHGATRERDLYRAMRDQIKSKAGALKFSKQLLDSAKKYGAILSSENSFWDTYSKSSRAHVSSLMSFNLQQIRPTLLALLETLPKPEIEAALKSLVAGAVRGIVTGGIGGGQAERYFCDAALLIRNKKTTTSKALMASLAPIVPNDREFERAFASYETRNNKLARYLLHAIERAMAGNAEPEFVPNEDAEEVNLEHILPKNAKATDWPAFSKDEMSTYPYRLGNMTLLQKGVNGKIGNKAWSVKKPKICLSSFELNKSVCAQALWRTGEIEQRQADLAKAAIAVWSA